MIPQRTRITPRQYQHDAHASGTSDDAQSLASRLEDETA